MPAIGANIVLLFTSCHRKALPHTVLYMSNFSFCTVSRRSYTAAVNNEFKECVGEDKELELYADIKICLNVLLVAVNLNQECNDYTCILGIRLQILQQSIGCWLIMTLLSIKQFKF